MRVLGFDPSTKASAWAVVDTTRAFCIVDCGVIAPPATAKAKGFDAACNMVDAVTDKLGAIIAEHQPRLAGIEGQHYKDMGSGVRVNNVLMLALVSGSALSVCRALQLGTVLLQPDVWTKGMPKDVRHARLREIHYPDKTDAALAKMYGFKTAQAYDVWDAIDMARFLAPQRAVGRR